MGDLFGGSKKTTTTDSGPWKDQQPYVKSAFNAAQTNFNQKSGTPWYTGETYAGINPLTRDAATATGTYATGQGKAGADATQLSGMGLLGQTGNYTDALGAYGSAAGVDNTHKIAADAGIYANNPALNGQIDAASRDVVRNLNENELPSIDRMATGTGNINSTRAGVAEGIAQRGAADRVGDIAAELRSHAYDTGLGVASTDNQNSLNAKGNAAQLYGSAVNSGGILTGEGQNETYTNLGKQGLAGGVLQADQQGQDDAALRSWQGNDTRQQQLIDNYYRTIGANNWGQSGTTTEETKNNPGILGAALGIGSLAASLYSGGAGLGSIGGTSAVGGNGVLSQAFQNAQNTPLTSAFAPVSPVPLPKFG